MSREDHERPGTADLLGRDHEPPLPGHEPAGALRHGGPDSRVQDVDARMARDPANQPMQHPDERVHAVPPQPFQQAHQGHAGAMPAMDAGQLAALFPPEMAADFRGRWDQVQIGFVDDPRQAVKQADELVAEVMRNLAARFADQRTRLEAGLDRGGEADTEGARMALQGYRSFFQRLLSL